MHASVIGWFGGPSDSVYSVGCSFCKCVRLLQARAQFSPCSATEEKASAKRKARAARLARMSEEQRKVRGIVDWMVIDDRLQIQCICCDCCWR